MTALTTKLSVAAIESPKPLNRTSILAGTRLTFGGLLFIAVLALVGLAALHNEANLWLLLVGMAIGTLCFSVVAPAWTVRKIEAQRILPDGVVAGHAFKIIYIVRNRRRWFSCWSLVIGEKSSGSRTVEFPRGFIPVLAPNTEQRIELTAQCNFRGRLTLPGIRITSRFPFGLFSCSVDLRAPATLVVYPSVARLTRDLWKDRRFGSASSRRSSRSTDQEEFYGVREYRQGDNYRWIHWRQSARTGELVVREMMPLRPAQVLIVLDPWPGQTEKNSTARDDVQAESEIVISLAATTICEYLHRGQRVGLICRSATPIVIAPGSGPAQRQRLLEELALITPPGAVTLDQVISQVRWSNGWQAQCLVCTVRADNSHQHVLRFLTPRAEAVALITPEMEGFDSLMEVAKEAPMPAARRRA